MVRSHGTTRRSARDDTVSLGGCAGDRDLIHVRKGSLERVLLDRSTCLGQAKCVARGHFRRRVIRPISPICTGGVLTEAPDSVPPVSTLATSIRLRTSADILCHGAPLPFGRDDSHRCRRSRCGGTVFPKPCVGGSIPPGGTENACRASDALCARSGRCPRRKPAPRDEVYPGPPTRRLGRGFAHRASPVELSRRGPGLDLRTGGRAGRRPAIPRRRTAGPAGVGARR